MYSSIDLFLFFSLLIFFINPESMRLLLLSSSFETKFLEFQSLPHGYLNFLGDSHPEGRGIALTKEGMRNDAPESAGVVFYRHPIKFLDLHSKKMPSFYTTFAFSIQNTYGNMNGHEKAFGDGLAFLISPDDGLLGSPGYLGLVDSTDLTRNKFIAIEFDTKCDSMFNDPDDNHVGLDINNLFSIKLARLSSLGVDLKSGDLITTWIYYKSHEKSLELFLSNSNLKPKKPVLKADIDLSDYLKEKNVFVGFSSATEKSRQATHIQQWEFTVMDFGPPPPPPSPHDSGRTLTNSQSAHKHSYLSRLAIGLIFGVCSLSLIVLIGWFCWKKLMGIIQKSEKINNVEMQSIRPSKGIASQEIQFSLLVIDVARGLNRERVSDKDAELICIRTTKSSIPLCNSLPAVKPNTLPCCNGLPLITNDITSV